MIAYNNIKPGIYIVLNGEPYSVLSSNVFRKQQRKPVNQTKLKNLLTKKVTERSFHQSEAIKEATIESREIKFIYCRNNVCWFQEVSNKKERVPVSETLLGEQKKFIKEGVVVRAFIFNDNIISLEIPVKLDFIVKESPPNIKGNTSQGGNKPVIIETGATISTPLFINTGDIIRVNTETGDYVERVEKK